jgi:spore maturation protein CgeB
MQVLGSGGLLLVDNVNGLELNLEDGKECVVMRFDGFEEIKNIKNIIDNYDGYKLVAQNGHKKAMERFTWENWAEKILRNL